LYGGKEDQWAEDTYDYVYNVKPILNKGGLFADGSKYYVSPQEPDVDQDVNVRFRTTADNVDEVFLIYNEEKTYLKVVLSVVLLRRSQLVIKACDPSRMYLKMISYEWQTSRYRCGIKVKYSVGTLLCHLYLFFIIYKEHFIHIIGRL